MFGFLIMKKYLCFIFLSLILSCTNNVSIPAETKPTNIQQENVNDKNIYDINSEYLLEKTNYINDCRIFTLKDVFISKDGNGLVSTESKNIYFDKNYKITDIKDLTNGVNQYKVDNKES